MMIMRMLLFVAIGLMPLLAVDDDIADLRQSLNLQFRGKTVTMRHFYANSRLLFDGDGKLSGLSDATPVGSWTTSARLEIQKLDLNNKKLTLQGRRILYRYDRSLGSFVDAGKDIRQLKPAQLAGLEAAQKFRVEVLLKKGTERVGALKAALDVIFLKGTEKLADFVPRYWKLVLRRETMPLPAEVTAWFAETTGVSITPFTPGIVSPRIISQSIPRYTEEARIFRASGIVVIAGVVDIQGRLRNPQITIPLGLGLDDSAIYDIAKWQFEPARLNDQPVPLLAHIETSFKLY